MQAMWLAPIALLWVIGDGIVFSLGLRLPVVL